MKKVIGLVTALWFALSTAYADPGPTDDSGCHGSADARHCHGGGGASGEALLVVAAVVAGTAYLVRKAVDNRRLRDAANPVPALQRYDDNRNGKISCREARRHGIAPASKEHAAYPYMRDLDGDGVACEGRGRAPAAGHGDVSDALPEPPILPQAGVGAANRTLGSSGLLEPSVVPR